jgi:hypothetical protein
MDLLQKSEIDTAIREPYRLAANISMFKKRNENGDAFGYDRQNFD